MVCLYPTCTAASQSRRIDHNRMIIDQGLPKYQTLPRTSPPKRALWAWIPGFPVISVVKQRRSIKFRLRNEIEESRMWLKAKRRPRRPMLICFPRLCHRRWVGYCTLSERCMYAMIDDVQELLNLSNSILNASCSINMHASLACSINHQSFLPILACILVIGGKTQGDSGRGTW
jgi:hypothetical protein